MPDADSTTDPPGGQPSATDTRFFGHPRGLATLFFTEMWERFSYYALNALLLLYMKADTRNGGLGFQGAKPAIIFGLYSSSVWLLSLPGGWVADRLLGARRAVLYGAILIAAGQFCLLPSGEPSLYVALVLIVLGTGLLKPNVSTIVGMLYPPGDHRRDGGFSIFYIGINLGSTFAPIVCGWLSQKVNWHLGFAVGGVGMVVGIVQYVLGARHLGNHGARPSRSRGAGRTAGMALAVVVLVAAAMAAVTRLAGLQITTQLISNTFGVGLLLIAIAMFAWMIFGPGWSALERKRALAILVLFVASCVFWSAYQQAGSTLTLFAADKTSDTVLGFHFPSSWFQSLNAIFIVLFAPIFAWLWIRLGKREPSSPTKFALGLVFVALGFAVLVPASYLAGRVSPLWLVATYLFHTWGELLLSPVGLSAMTKLAPARVVSLMMGVWFLSISVGAYLGGQAASLYATLPLPKLFGAVAAFAFVAALILFLVVKPTVRLMSGVK